MNTPENFEPEPDGAEHLDEPAPNWTELPKPLAKKLVAAYGKIDRVPKSGENKRQGFQFATAADVTDAARNALHNVGLAIIPSFLGEDWSQRPTQSGGTMKVVKITVELTIVDADTGASFVSTWRAEAEDSTDKALTKAVTALYKSFLKSTLLISTGDDPDADEAPPRPDGTDNTAPDPTEQQRNRALHDLADAIEAADIDPEEHGPAVSSWAAAHFGVDTVNEARPEQIDKIVDSIRGYSAVGGQCSPRAAWLDRHVDELELDVEYHRAGPDSQTWRDVKARWLYRLDELEALRDPYIDATVARADVDTLADLSVRELLLDLHRMNIADALDEYARETIREHLGESALEATDTEPPPPLPDPTDFSEWPSLVELSAGSGTLATFLSTIAPNNSTEERLTLRILELLVETEEVEGPESIPSTTLATWIETLDELDHDARTEWLERCHAAGGLVEP